MNLDQMNLEQEITMLDNMENTSMESIPAQMNNQMLNNQMINNQMPTPMPTPVAPMPMPTPVAPTPMSSMVNISQAQAETETFNFASVTCGLGESATFTKVLKRLQGKSGDKFRIHFLSNQAEVVYAHWNEELKKSFVCLGQSYPNENGGYDRFKPCCNVYGNSSPRYVYPIAIIPISGNQPNNVIQNAQAEFRSEKRRVGKECRV